VRQPTPLKGLRLDGGEGRPTGPLFDVEGGQSTGLPGALTDDGQLKGAFPDQGVGLPFAPTDSTVGSIASDMGGFSGASNLSTTNMPDHDSADWF
jgi:hypothetical protein